MALEQIGLQAVLQDKDFQAGMRRYNDGLNQMTHNTDRSANAISAAFARVGSLASGALTIGIGAATAAFGALAAASKIGLDAAISWGEELDKLQQQFGGTTETAAKWAASFQHVGLSSEEGATGLNFFTRGMADLKKQGASLVPAKSMKEMEKLKEQLADANVELQRRQKTLSESKKPTDQQRYAVEDTQKKIAKLNKEIAAGSKLVSGATDKSSDFEKALTKLEVKAFDNKGKLKTLDQVMPEIMDKFKKMPNGIEKTNLAMSLFGARGGSKFLDWLELGSDGLAKIMAMVKEFGLDFDQGAVDALEEFGFAMNDVNLKIKAMWSNLGTELLPYFKRMVDYISNNILPALNRWVFDTVPKVTRGLDQFITFAQTKLIPVFGMIYTKVMNFVSAFQKGGASGVFDQLGKELGNVFKGFDLTRSLQGISTQLQAVWSNTIAPELAKWGARFWDWLTGGNTGGGAGFDSRKGMVESGGAIGAIGREFGKVASAIQMWASSNAPKWAEVMRGWAVSFWTWLTDKDKGAIAEAGRALLKFSEELRDKVATEDYFRQVGAEITKSIFGGMSDASIQTPLIIEFATNLGKAFLNLPIIFDIIGTSFKRGMLEGIYRNLGLTEDEARRAAEIAMPYNLQTMFYMRGNTIGQTGGDGIRNGITSKSGVIIGAALGVVNSASASAMGAAQGGGRNVGVAFGNGIIAGIASASVGISQTVASILGSAGASAGSGSSSGSGSSGGGRSIVGRASTVAAPQVVRNTSSSRSVSVTNHIAGDVSGLSQARVAEISQQIAHATVSAVLGMA